jgi:pyruvate formate lyase activating enzyme
MENLFLRCQICETKKPIFSKYLGICPECIRLYPDKAITFSKTSIQKARNLWKLPIKLPLENQGRKCHLCSNECIIDLGKRGYCGIWKNENGKLRTIAGKNNALLHTYLDPLPTNCCSTYFCPGGSAQGYNDYSYSKTAEYGYNNLACFLYG